ncbi:MAG: hypothetical protein AAB413_05710 [Patescibacteria group bacterium]
MSQTNLQLPIDTRMRDKAKVAATRQGFSSLQEMIRVFLTQIVDERLSVSFIERPVALTKKAEARYQKLLAQKSDGKAFSSVDELIAELGT